MSCGQKNQNKPEGGLHLTERTCSPYNPIIKQIVDDCLGLPVYPVTSIDAVIDEDGNTLRKLLDDLIDQIKNGTFDIPELKEKIEYIENIVNTINSNYISRTELTNIINGLDDTYATDADLAALANLVNSLKTLLWAISAITDTNTSGGNNFAIANLYDIDGVTPKIVAEFRKLQQDVLDIIGGGDGISLETLNNAIRDLKALLNAVVQFDTTYTIEIDGERSIIPIIQEILNIKNLLGLNGSDPEEKTILERIEDLESAVEDLEGDIENLTERVATLEEESKTHAHLDPEVLDQQEGTAINPEVFHTLKAGELPPTTIDMVRAHTQRRFRKERIEYFGLYPGEIDTGPNDTMYRQLDIYPLGHSNITGKPLFVGTKVGNDMTYAPLVNINNEQLYAGNNKVTIEDLGLILKMYKESDKPAELVDEISSSRPITNNQLYFKFDQNYYPVGDTNLDGEVGIADFNSSFRDYLNNTYQQSSEIYTLPSTYGEEGQRASWLEYYEENQTDPSAIYPCIEGKLYVDYFTGFTYRYSDGRMHRVNFIEFEEDGDVEIEQSFVNSETSNGEPHMKVTIKVSEPTEYTGDSEDPLFELTVEDDEQQENSNKVITLSKENNIVVDNPSDLFVETPSIFNPELRKGSYYIKTTPRRVLLAYSDLDSSDVGSALGEVEYDIAHVTGMIDILLGSSVTTTRILSHSLLKKYINNKKTSQTWTVDEYELLNSIEQHLNSYDSTIGSSTITEQSDSITYWYVDEDDYEANNNDATVKEDTATGGNAEIVRSLLHQYRDGNNELQPLKIEAVTLMIDKLLSGQGEMWYTEPEQLDAVLWQVTIETPITESVTPNSQNSLEFKKSKTQEKGNLIGKIFRIARDENVTATEDWYYYDRHLDFVPLIPKYTLGVEKEDLCLYRNNDVVSRIPIGASNGGNISEGGEPQEIQKELNNVQVTYPVFLGETVDPSTVPGQEDPDDEQQWQEVDVSEFKYIKHWNQNVYQNNVISNIPEVSTLSDKFVLFKDAADDSNPIVNISPVVEFNVSTFVSDYILSELARFGFTPETDGFAELIEVFLNNIFEFTYKCIELSQQKLYTVRHTIKFTYDGINTSILSCMVDDTTESGYRIEFDQDYIEYLVEVVDEEPLKDNVVYNLDPLGVSLKFKIEGTQCIPIIVSVDKYLGHSRSTTTTTNEGKVTDVKIFPNEYLQLTPPTVQNLETNVLNFDLTHLIHIPGYEMIKVQGTFEGKSGLTFDFTTGTGYSIETSSANPAVLDNKLYEYTFFNNRFSFKEI